MSQLCPKCGHRRQVDEMAPSWQCPACGIAYAKIRPSLEDQAQQEIPQPTDGQMADEEFEKVKERVLDDVRETLRNEILKMFGISLSIAAILLPVLEVVLSQRGAFELVKEHRTAILVVLAGMTLFAFYRLIVKILEIKHFLDELGRRSGWTLALLAGLALYLFFILFEWSPEPLPDVNQYEARDYAANIPCSMFTGPGVTPRFFNKVKGRYEHLIAPQTCRLGFMPGRYTESTLHQTMPCSVYYFDPLVYLNDETGRWQQLPPSPKCLEAFRN